MVTTMATLSDGCHSGLRNFIFTNNAVPGFTDPASANLVNGARSVAGKRACRQSNLPRLCADHFQILDALLTTNGPTFT